MLAVLSWLKEFAQVEASPKAICDAMTLSGSKVEYFHQEAGHITGVVTGKITSIAPHPNADRLRICQVQIDEEGKQYLQIVTAATNVKEGDVVPVALDGADLHDGLKIKKGKLRGELSEGMFCSVEEFGYSREEFPEAPEHGVYVFQKPVTLGLSIHEALGFKECLIEFEITSNRPDCFSMEGLGRELALTYDVPFHAVEPKVQAQSTEMTATHIALGSVEAGRCAHYELRYVDNVVVQPSPEWLQKRLRLAGIRPINNVVDVTNYVLLELGQPLHAFDYDELQGPIDVRFARASESLTLLDETELELKANDLIIADAKRPLALAGIMGGLGSSVTEKTKRIVLEAAYFEPKGIRLSSQQHGIRTESSSRFEKGLDVQNVHRALDRALELIEALSCGRVSSEGLIFESTQECRPAIEWSSDRINKLLGLDLPVSYMEELFTKLGATLLEKGLLQAPSYRPDLEGEADLAEEVARFYGYNKIPATLLDQKSFVRGGLTPVQRLKELLTELCLAHGFDQAMTYSFESPKTDDWLLLEQESPLRKRARLLRSAEELSVMRSSLLPSFLKLASHNSKRWVKLAQLFELSKVFSAELNEEGLPSEKNYLAAIRYDLEEEKKGGRGFFVMKGLLENLLQELGLKDYQLRAEATASFNPYRSASVYCRGQLVGQLGYLMPEVLKHFSAPASTVYLELNLDLLLPMANLKRSQKPFAKFPPMNRDLAFTLKKEHSAASVEQVIRKKAKPHLDSLELFDLYEGKQIEDGYKSMAYRLRFRSLDKTLTDDEVNQAMEAVVESLAKQLEAKVRS